MEKWLSQKGDVPLDLFPTLPYHEDGLAELSEIES